MDLKEAVLSRVDAVELVGQYVALTQAGKSFKGRCPFHEEKTPSFHVSPENQLFHCFGCKAGGNVIDFVMRIENLEFRDALEWLARRYNIDIAQYSGHGGGGGGAGEKERMYKLNEAAAQYFRKLLASGAGEGARDYLAKRGVPQRALADFDLGYSPREWTALADTLLSAGAKGAELVRIGLIKPRSEASSGFSGQSQYYDTFRHRLIFPIRNVTGRVIAFAGRALSAEDNPKYLNVANTPLYDKSRTLYNLERAKGVLREEGAVVVEGYMDVIGLDSAGVHNAVASCGTALTAEHVKLLTRYAEQFYLAFDGDEAGRRAAWGAGSLFLRQGLSCRVLKLPAGVDPDEFARAEGLDGWTKLKKQARSVVRFWLECQLEARPDPDPTQLKRWVMQLAPLYRQIPDELTRQEFKQDVASALRLGAEEAGGLLSGAPLPAERAGGERTGGGRGRWRDQLSSVSGLKPGQATEQVLAHEQRDKPQRITEARQQAKLQGARHIEREVLRRLLSDDEFRYTCGVLAEMEGFAAWLTDPLTREVFAKLAAGEQPQQITAEEKLAAPLAGVLNAEPLLEDNDLLLIRLRNMHLERRINELMARHKDAAAAGDDALELRIIAEVQQLKRQIKPLRSLDSGV